MRRLAVAPLLLLSSCLAFESSSEQFQAPSERLRKAIEGLLSQEGQVESEGDEYSTGWIPDSAVRSGWTGGGTITASRTRYRVKVDGSRIDVTAWTEAFVSRGTHHHQWESVDPKTARDRFLRQLREALRPPQDQ
jgi:hypothetical protein